MKCPKCGYNAKETEIGHNVVFVCLDCNWCKSNPESKNSLHKALDEYLKLI